MRLEFSESLPALVEARYSAAKSSAALLFAESELSITRTRSAIPFQVRFCPSLAKKPVPKLDTEVKKRINPFENPSGSLLIGKFPQDEPSHILVLNKFPIIPAHFILATKEFKQQTDDLEPEDLDAVYSCLRAWEQDNSTGFSQRRLFAFFNSGPHSGASQAHRHIQLLPVENVSTSSKPGEWHLLMDSPSALQSMPFKHFAQNLPPNPSPLDLDVIYRKLLHSCQESWYSYAKKSGGTDVGFSYNMGMTTSSIVLCPRTHEGMTIQGDNESTIGPIAFNGTLLAGTVMVKRREEWDHLQHTPSTLDKVLEEIGVPKKYQESNWAHTIS